MNEQQIGSGPPAHIEPQDLWARLTTLPRPRKEVAFPRKDPATGEWMTDKVVLWVLTESELMSARAAAELYAREMLSSAKKAAEASGNDVSGGIGYQQIYTNAVVVECLWRCCRSAVEPRLSAFPSTQLMRKHFTSDECAVLFRAYCAFQTECGPLLSSMTKEEMDAWIDVLKEGGSRVPLARLPLENVTELLMHSVSLLPKSQADNGSVGSPQNEFSQSTGRRMQSPQSSPSSRQDSFLPEVDASERPAMPERDE